MDTAELRNLGRNAFDGRSWRDAYEELAAADEEEPLAPDELERLATAAYLTGHDDVSTAAWARAHRGWLDAGDHERAVRCAFWLGFGLVQRGDLAQGGGWLGRAAAVVDQHRLDSVEQGYLLLPRGLQAMGGGDTDGALATFERVAELARRFDDPDLGALGAIGRGEALLRSGRTEDGSRLFDQAMVSVTAGETSPVAAGIVYCAVINTCHELFDLRRAREWTEALHRWCDGQPGLVPYRGQCMVHRSQILQVAGEWDAALAEAECARQRLAEPPHPAIGMAHYQLGELHRLRGHVAAAEDAYRQAHACGRDPQPGLALLRLDQGRPDVAAAAMETALEQATDAVSRARLLPAYAQILLVAGRTDDARHAAETLDGLAKEAGATLLTAVACQTRGAVLVAEGRPKAALEPLHQALEAWRGVHAPYEEAQVRLLLASACRAVEDHDRAAFECDAARRAFEAVGAAPALAQLEDLVADTASSSPSPVTERELEVLRLVAAGRTNRELAGDLSISERTVERHLSNIFTKLGVSNRAAATAYAYDRGLL